MDRKVKFGLIGCGSIAKKHVIALSRLRDAEIVGACDLDYNIAERFCKEYSLPLYRNAREMVEASDPDLFSILTPSGDHARSILSLMRFNKHFVVEKPLALRLDDIDRILDESSRRKIMIFVVKQNRFNPPAQKLKEAVDAGRFGKLVMGSVRVRWCRDQAYYDKKPWRGTWALDGGVLTNQASHHIDMLIWLMGPVESVVAKTATRLVNIESEDTGAVILKFQNGALGLIEATTATRPRDLEGSISILGERGSVEIGGFFMNELKTWNFSQSSDQDRDIWQNFSKVPDIFAWNHTEFLKDIVHSIANNRPGLVDGFEGRKTVELINAIYESAETGREVYLNLSTAECRLGRVTAGAKY